MARSKVAIPIHIVQPLGTTLCGDCWELQFEGHHRPYTLGSGRTQPPGVPQLPKGTARFPGIREPTSVQPPRHKETRRIPTRNRSSLLRVLLPGIVHGLFGGMGKHYEISPILLMESFTEEEKTINWTTTVIIKSFPKKFCYLTHFADHKSSLISGWRKPLLSEWLAEQCPHRWCLWAQL